MKNFPSSLQTLLLLIAICFVSSSQVYAQAQPQVLDSLLQSDSFTESLAEKLGAGNSSEDGAPKETYIDNSIKQLNVVNKRMMESAWQREQLQRMREAATKLCDLDQRACYLIDNYRAFKANEKSAVHFLDLALFGTDIFSSYPLSFDVIDNAPVPSSYIVNTGDILHISLSGATVSFEKDSMVMRDGSIFVKGIGEISVAGKTYLDAVSDIKSFVKEIQIGATVSVSMKTARSMNIFMLGATDRAGSYRVGSQASVLNALSAIGGLKSNASLRYIEVSNNSGNKSMVDLYKPLIYGEIDSSMHLSDGSSILIPAAENIITVYGEVNRPAKYELMAGERLDSAIEFALGFTPNADQSSIVVRRRNVQGKYDVISTSDPSNFQLKNGDIILVNKIQGDDQGFIVFEGALRNPGLYTYNNSLGFRDYIDSSLDLLDNAYPVFIVRKSFNQNTKSWFFNNYTLTNTDSINSIEIESNDHFYIFSTNDVRFLATKQLGMLLRENHQMSNGNNNSATQDGIRPPENAVSKNDFSCITNLTEYVDSSFYDKYSENMKLVPGVPSFSCPEIFQSSQDLLAYTLDHAIPLFGALRKPGLYPIAKNTPITDVLALAGGSRESKTEIEFGLKENTELYSYIKVKNNYANKGIDTVSLIGQFNNPGVYKIESKETISQLVKRAGGFRDDAYPIAGIYTRESIKIMEVQALEKSSKELADLLSTAITSGYLKQDSADLMNLMSIMNQANTIEASGRLITNLDADSIQGTRDDFFVMPGDIFYLPKRPHSVTVSGNVLNPLTVSYDPGLSYRDYISLAGGFKDNGSKKNTFIILPNGKTFQPTSRIFSNNKSFILPGSTIIVPREARPLSGLSLVEVLSPTLANLSVTAASIAAITKD